MKATVNNKKVAKKAWRYVKNKVKKSEIISVSIQRKAEEVGDDLILEPIDGVFEVKLMCRDK